MRRLLPLLLLLTLTAAGPIRMGPVVDMYRYTGPGGTPSYTWTYNCSNSAGNKTSGSTDAIGLCANYSVNDVLIAIWVGDNINTTDITSGGTEHAYSSTPSQTWNKFEARRGAGSAAAGVTVSVGYSQLSSSMSIATDFVSMTFSSAITAKVRHAMRFIPSGGTMSLAGSNGANGSSTTPSCTISGLTSAEYLFVGVVGREGPYDDTYTADSDYSSNTVVPAYTTGSSAASNVSMVRGYRIATGTGDTYNPSLGTSRDWSCVLLAFKLS